MNLHWRQLGKLFDPTEHRVEIGSTTFAQSPQTLVLEDRIRIYFSTRTQDQAGMYLSHVCFVDFSKNLQTFLGVSHSSVITLGEKGSFDEHGIFPFHVQRVNNRVLAYTSGWSRRISTSVETSIGLAESFDDGRTFHRLGPGPILTASLREPFLVGDPFVVPTEDQFHMWYIFGTAWRSQCEGGTPERVYKIGHAVSDDGMEWTKNREGEAIVEDRVGSDECQALPTVFQHRNRWHMIFCYREMFGFRADPSRAYRLGYAWSEDLVTWTRDDERCILMGAAQDWEAEMRCYPHVFSCENEVYLLYNGNAFGKYGFGAGILAAVS